MPRARPASWRDGWGTNVVLAVALVALIGVGAAWAITASTSSEPTAASVPSPSTAEMEEYVAGHWVRFTSPKPLSPEQWSVVDAYANFSSVVLAVYATRSVAPLVAVVAPQSRVIAMFARDLATGSRPEALYTRATVEQVSISGCRARLALELYYPDGRRLQDVSSWVRPFDRAGLGADRSGARGPRRAPSSLEADEYAPWQFVGDNRVGGVDTPCGV